jgi:hypothetical protein
MKQEAKDGIIGKVRASWQFRAEQYTRGNATVAGAILLGVLKRKPHKPPAIGSKAAINTDGMVYASYMAPDGTLHRYYPICHADQLRDTFRDLADKLKLDDKDRLAMFDEVKKWIVKDFRAKPDEDLF